MKVLLSILFVSIFTQISFCQFQIRYLEFNNVRSLITNKGSIGFNPQSSASSYEVPIGSGNHVIYAHTPLWSATDGNGSVKGAFSYYNMNVSMSGPISNNYDSQWQNENRAFYDLYYYDVQDHINNYDQPGYTMSTEITEWPAEGNISESGSAFLAPFEDENYNGEYDPENGDYPIMYGDHMLFSIFNYDSLPSPTFPNNQSTPLEVQMGSYQFATNNYINETTFMYYRVENKSQDTLFDFRWGNMVDFDIGYSQEDFIGSDVNRNLVYAYNGDNTDEGGSGQPGYGTNPPAVGIISLNNPLDVTNYVGDANNNSDYQINSLSDLKNVMEGKNSQGMINTDNNGAPVQMIYNENPDVSGSYSEFQQGNSPGERRILYSTESYDLKPGESKCYHFAIIYSRESQNDHVENVASLLATADQVQSFFDLEIDPTCYEKPTLSMEENELNNKGEITVYPNPSKDFIDIESTQEVKKLIILDQTGRVVAKTNGASNYNHLSIESWSKGVYIIKAVLNNGTVVQKRFIKS